MKILKMHLIEAAVAVLFVVLVFVLCHGDGEEVIEDMSYNQNWTSVVGGEKQEYEILPETVGLSYREEVVILRKNYPRITSLRISLDIIQHTSYQRHI